MQAENRSIGWVADERAAEGDGIEGGRKAKRKKSSRSRSKSVVASFTRGSTDGFDYYMYMDAGNI